jgi:hypothetical protein
MIYFEGPTSRKSPSINGLQNRKTEKSEKTRKKMSFLRREPPVLLPKRPFLGSKLIVKLLLALQVVIHESLETPNGGPI